MSGPPIVLLHGPGAYAAAWMRVIPGLVTTHRVVAPDLPGHGASAVAADELDVDRVVAWLAELVEGTCPSPPVLVGHLLGGALAARFGKRSRRSAQPTGACGHVRSGAVRALAVFGSALMSFLAQPTADTQDGLWQRCSFDLDALRQALGQRWEALKTYNLDLANTPAWRKQEAS